MLLVRHVGGIECRDRKRGNEEEKRDVAIIKRVVAHFAVRLMRILNGLFARNNVD